ncbi:MAG: hypothetical protein K6E97_11450 [Treponema sp.]|nr:hypothetical protein [Treponema sp.]
MKKNLKYLFVILLFSNCNIYNQPEGKAELLDKYTYQTYLEATLKLTNIGTSNIHNANITIKALSKKNIVYYNSLSLDAYITPGNFVCIPIKMELNSKIKNELEWNKDSMEIINTDWK